MTRRAFTLLEVMVVLIILAILATLTVPRLTSIGRRTLQVTAEQVADLLTMYAQRETLSDRPVGIILDSDRNWLMLVGLVGDESGGDQPEWIVDRYVQPVKLPDSISVLDVTSDEVPVDITEWPLSHTPGENRPLIVITLQSPDRIVTVMLEPHAIAPRIYDTDAPPATERTAYDLDAAGLSREEW